MVNVKELERRWFRYKIKKLLPLFSIVLISFISVIVFLLMNFSKENTKTTKAISSNQAIQTSQKTTTSIQAKENSKQLNHNETKPHTQPQQLKPSFDFLTKMKYDEIIPKTSVSHSYQTTKANPIKHRKPPKVSQKTPQEKRLYTQSTTHKQFINTKNKEKLKIKTKKISEQEIQDILHRFKKTNNPNLSLFVAKKYYELGNYNKAYNYALITNEIDNTLEDSWIIFAKSLYKLGYKQRAIKTLKAYINYSHSHQAKMLLNNIQTGKFK